MGILKTELQRVDEQVKYGFELALRYAKLAKEYDKDIIEELKDKLEHWND